MRQRAATAGARPPHARAGARRRALCPVAVPAWTVRQTPTGLHRHRRGDHDAVTATRSRGGHGDELAGRARSRPAFGRSRPTCSKRSTITVSTVATFSVAARTVTVFIRCTSPGHPPFLHMNVYFPHRAGKLEGGGSG